MNRELIKSTNIQTTDTVQYDRFWYKAIIIMYVYCNDYRLTGNNNMKYNLNVRSMTRLINLLNMVKLPHCKVVPWWMLKI